MESCADGESLTPTELRNASGPLGRWPLVTRRRAYARLGAMKRGWTDSILQSGRLVRMGCAVVLCVVSAEPARVLGADGAGWSPAGKRVRTIQIVG